MAFSYTWNESSPDGSTDPVSGLDTQIQNLKKAIRERVATRGATGTITPEADWTVGVVHYNTSTQEINYSLSASTWARVGINFADGTAAIFFQASAPTGWTIKPSGVTHDGMLIASINGNGGATSGAGHDPASFSLPVASGGLHTHTSDAGTAHSHTTGTPSATNNFNITPGTQYAVPDYQHTHTVSSESTHTHTVSSSGAHTHSTTTTNFFYNTVCICTKNAVNT